MGKNETLKQQSNYFRVFPSPHDVFADRVDEHSEYLLPLATVSLTHLSPAWQGEIHFVMPIEPGPGWGYVGDRSKLYHNYHCRPNWIGYRLRDNRCELACDFRFFHKAYFKSHPPEEKRALQEAKELPLHYERTRAEFDSRQRFFMENGFLQRSEHLYTERYPRPDKSRLLPLVESLGGESRETNWTATDFPLSIYPQPSDPELDASVVEIFEKTGIKIEWSPGLPIALPKTESGRDFTFVGFIDMATYVGDTDGGLLLFYDHHDGIALTTFDWT